MNKQPQSALSIARSRAEDELHLLFADSDKRLEEVIGMLNAYRQGWISYDQAHVRQLKAEYDQLSKGAK